MHNLELVSGGFRANRKKGMRWKFGVEFKMASHYLAIMRGRPDLILFLR
jgi:hypothetical protein